MPRTSRDEVARLRSRIVARAIDLASVDGLEGLTIGRLGSALAMSKSGLFAHFGSKEELQLAVVEAAREIFERDVHEPARRAEPGLPRLIALADRWIGHLERGPHRGGFFFASVAHEVDDKPGRIRDRVVELTRAWLDELELAAEAAQDAGDLASEADPAQIAFELHAFVQQANWSFQLHGDTTAFHRARRAIARALLEAGARDLAIHD